MSKYVLLIKSRQTKKPATEDSDELSIYEKLKAALEERVEKAQNERDRNRALLELREFTSSTGNIPLLKTHVHGYTKKDGTFVTPHEDSRAARDESHQSSVRPKKFGKIGVIDTTLGEFKKDPESFVDWLVDALGENVSRYVKPGEAMAVGLRGVPSESELGKVPRPSWQNVDGETPYRLDGTSTIGVSLDYDYAGFDQLLNESKRALNLVERYAASTGYVAVVVGKNSAQNRKGIANDIGETIIEKPKVIAYIPTGLVMSANRSTFDSKDSDITKSHCEPMTKPILFLKSSAPPCDCGDQAIKKIRAILVLRGERGEDAPDRRLHNGVKGKRV